MGLVRMNWFTGIKAFHTEDDNYNNKDIALKNHSKYKRMEEPTPQL